MNPELEKLIQFQQAESELRRLENELATVPEAKRALEERLAADRAVLDTTREAVEECGKNRRRHEGDLQDLETRRSRYKQQLMDVKTNKEYTAMLHEIEGVERQIGEREDQILEEMERADTLATDVKQADVDFKAAEQRHTEEAKSLAEKESALGERLTTVRAERDELATAISAPTLELFRRVAKLRGGVAVAEARDAQCQLCHVVLRPQMFVDIKLNQQILQCPACNRILFYEPPPPVVVPPDPS